MKKYNDKNLKELDYAYIQKIFGTNALLAYNDSSSEIIYIDIDVNFDKFEDIINDNIFYLFLDNDFEMQGSLVEFEEYFLNEYLNLIEEIKKSLIDDGINFSLVSKMTDNELQKANSIQDYDEYNDYLNYLMHKYDI